NQPFGSQLPPLGKLLNPNTGFWQNAEASAAPKKLNFETGKLKAPVEVVFDDRLVPHLYGQNNNDLAYVQGYLHAMHRLWQMDIATRAVGGRLSEVLGARTLSRDKLQKKKGFIFAAENALRAWKSNPNEWGLVEAYTEGVNDYLAQLQPKDYPLEFKILDYQPEAWTPLKSALFQKYMAESLCARHRDVPATNTKIALGEELFDFLYPEYNSQQSPIIPADVEFDFEDIKSPFPNPNDSNQLSYVPHEMFELPHPNNGSNNWAISPERSATGNAILCSDPHLGLTLPSIWYEIHLNTPAFNSYGVSLPALPGILIGFNDYIAWAETNVGHDVLDWYRIKWTDDSKAAYWLDGKEVPTEIRKDTVWYNGKSSYDIVETKYTVWGPVVHEDTASAYNDMAMRWIAHDQPEEKPFYEFGTFWQLKAAKNHTDYKEALKGYDAPAQNFAFAATNGDVAITVNGKLPVKRDQQGRFVQDGSESENGWNGFIPRDQLPQVLNPERGFISSANQHSTDEDYPYYYNGGFDDFRGRTVNRMLDSLDKATIADVMAMQNSSFSLYAEEALPAYLAMLDQSKLGDAELQALKTLEDWDFKYDRNSIAPVLFEALDDSIYDKTMDEIAAFAKDQSFLYPESWRLLEIIKQVPDHPIFDHQATETTENAQSIVNQAFKEALANVSDKTWLKENRPSVNHMASIAPFGFRDVEIDGTGWSLNAIRGNHGPSWRMVVEMDPEGVKANVVYPGGQSGNPGSPFYDNMVQQWAAGEYNQAVFPRKRDQFPADAILFKMEFN
ncbi:MAG: penicillin acylase family protein, partial [Bacteroidota bacterium]